MQVFSGSRPLHSQEGEKPGVVPGLVLPSRKEPAEIMSTNKAAGKTERATAVTTIIAGARKRLPNGNQTLPVGASTMTVAAVLGQLQTIVDNRAAVVAAQATAKAKVAVEMAAMPALDAILSAFEAFIRFTFG